MPRILITNDDGIHHPGIIALEHRLRSLGQLTVVAPAQEMSGSSRAMTLTRPLRLDRIDGAHYAVDGTPVDCVTLALGKLMVDAPPDLVVSGINQGSNLGDDVLYSGTVAGAAEAIVYGLPGLAFSLRGRNASDFGPAADVAAVVAEKVLHEGLPENTILNVNIPHGPIRGVRITRQGNKVVRPRIVEGIDPRGRQYYWIGQTLLDWKSEADTDYEAVERGYISITPLHDDLTNTAVLEMATFWNSLAYEYQPLEGWSSG